MLNELVTKCFDCIIWFFSSHYITNCQRQMLKIKLSEEACLKVIWSRIWRETGKIYQLFFCYKIWDYSPLWLYLYIIKRICNQGEKQHWYGRKSFYILDGFLREGLIYEVQIMKLLDITKVCLEQNKQLKKETREPATP